MPDLRLVGLDARVKESRVRIVVEEVDSKHKVSIDWLTGATPSGGIWAEGDPIVEIAKQFDLVHEIAGAVRLSALRVVVDA